MSLEESSKPNRRAVLKGLAALAATAALPAGADAAENKSPEKKEQSRLLFLRHAIEDMAGPNRLNDTELSEFAAIKQKHADWKNRGFPEDGSYTSSDQNRLMVLRDKIDAYKKTLNSIADMYPQPPDYKGKNDAREELERFNAKARGLGFEP